LGFIAGRCTSGGSTGTVDDGEHAPVNSRELEVRKEVVRLKRLLADKTLEVDFFKGALQKVEARRRNRDHSNAPLYPVLPETIILVMLANVA
jgi:hypothetical protein